MQAVVIVSKNQDFTDVASQLIRKELGMDCHVVSDSSQAHQWPDALAITDENLPVRMQDIFNKIRSNMLKSDNKIMLGNWELSPRLKTLSHGQVSINLTDKEVQLLQCLKEAGTCGIGRDNLLKEVWGFAPGINTHTLETHIYRLRSKIKELVGNSLIIDAADGKYGLRYE